MPRVFSPLSDDFVRTKYSDLRIFTSANVSTLSSSYVDWLNILYSKHGIPQSKELKNKIKQSFRWLLGWIWPSITPICFQVYSHTVNNRIQSHDSIRNLKIGEELYNFWILPHTPWQVYFSSLDMQMTCIYIKYSDKYYPLYTYKVTYFHDRDSVRHKLLLDHLQYTSLTSACISPPTPESVTVFLWYSCFSLSSSLSICICSPDHNRDREKLI